MSSKTRARRKTGDTRELILEATWRLLEGGAGASVGLEQVATRAGISRQAVYLHFGSRTNLLLALVNHIGVSHRMPERTQAMMTAPSAAAGLDIAIDLHADFNGKVLVVANALDVARRSDPVAASVWEDRMSTRREGMHRVIERLAAEGRLRRGLSIDQATDLLWMLLSVRVWEDLVVARGWSRASYARHIKRLVRKSIVAPAAHSKSK